MAKFEKPPRDQMAKIETELAEMKAMQTKFTDTLAQMLAEQKLIFTQAEAAGLTISAMMVKLTQLSQQLTRVEEQITLVTASLKTSTTSDVKTAEKLETSAPSPFSGFKFGLSKSEEQTPVLGAWPAPTTAPLISNTAMTTFCFSPTTTVPAVASSPSGSKDATANDEQGADTEGEDYECTAQFRPVMELPQLVETKTDEEDEDVKFCERAKLYRYDTEAREWKERGLGEMKILRNQTTGKYRILMRREQILKICANHQIIPGLKLMPRKKPTEYTWAAPDFADGEQKNERFVVRFKTKEQAEKFKAVFEEGLVSSQSMSPVKPQAPKTEAPSTTTESTPLPSLSELFKPAAGSWSCGLCYVDNKSDAATCIACRAPNPSKATQPSGGASSGAAAVSSPFEFGIQAAVKEEKKEKKLPSLGELFKSDPKSWNCTLCCVDNSPSSDKCVACETVKSGNAPTGPFKFGSSTPFVFGSGDEDFSAKTQVSEALTSSTFTFATTPATPSTFTFGNTPATSLTFTFGNTPATSPAFTFGNTPATSRAFTFGTSSATSPPFTFGTSSATSPPFTFGTAPATFVVAQPATSFVFGPTVNTPNTLATNAKKGTFAEQSTTEDQKSSIPELSPGFSFKFPQQHGFSFEKRHPEDKDDQVVESQDRDFAPAVASLPPEIEVVTGEEGQEVLYCQRAKLFRIVNKEWKERGVGDFKLLRDPNTLKIRLTMRREKVHKVCLNHYLTRDMKFNKLENENVIQWSALDFSEGEIEPTLFAIRVRSFEIVSEMLDAILNAQKGVCEDPVDCSTPKVDQPMSETKSRARFEETVDAGKSSAVGSSDPVEIFKVEEASEADVRRARELMLPDHFYLYESRQSPCKGCRGCEGDIEEDSPVTKGDSPVTEGDSPVTTEESPVTAEESPVTAGEVQDEVLYSQLGKLYVYDAQTSEWKERAIGDAEILRRSAGRARIVVRRDKAHKVACNHYITDGMELKPHATATNTLTWSAVDFVDNDPTPQLFALKVETKDHLSDFKRIFAEEVERDRKAKEGADGFVII